MNLLVDIGNSCIKWCSRRSADGLSRLRVADYARTNLGVCLDAQWDKLKKPEHIWVSNVAGRSVARQLTRWTVARWSMEPHFAGVSRAAGGVRNSYSEFTQLGVDRWLALIGTWQKYKSPACIVDCGTAITIDGLDSTGRHLGGLILPGVSMMQQTLHQSAVGIPAIDKAQVVRGLADNTLQGVATGCTMAVIALIDRTVDALKRNKGGKLTCVITGGGARNIMSLLKAEFIHEPLLVLQGLAVMADDKA